MKYIPIILLLAACTTQKKVTRWLNEHRVDAAKYCADQFPPDTLSKQVFQFVDSSGYEAAYWDLAWYADSLFTELDNRTTDATPERPYKPNIDSIRKVVNIELRRRLKPCVDSVKHITHTIVDKAREKYLQGMIDKKDDTITKLQGQNATLQDNVAAAKKWMWWFWILVLLIGAYVFGRVKRIVP